MTYILLALAGAIALFFIRGFRKRRSATAQAPVMSPRKAHRLLLKHVRFYKGLKRGEQAHFRVRLKAFLDTVAITPVGEVEVTPLDRLYVAAAAIIPVFRYPDWEYRNLNEVLIYPGNFSRSFGKEEDALNTMGMVGDGAMHRMMVLSIDALRTGFEQQGRSNTGIHEFVHLIDKSDGATDGLPELLLPESLISPWLDHMRHAIEKIREGQSDINPYGATSETEFLPVVSEYYFQRPQFLAEKHPELFSILEIMYGGSAAEAAIPEENAAASDAA